MAWAGPFIPGENHVTLTHVRYSLSSVWVRLSIFSPLSIIQYLGLCVFSLPIPLVIIERIYILCLIIIFKSEVWTITHCLGLGHETMVCALLLSIFLRNTVWFPYNMINVIKILTLVIDSWATKQVLRFKERNMYPVIVTFYAISRFFYRAMMTPDYINAPPKQQHLWVQCWPTLPTFDHSWANPKVLYGLWSISHWYCQPTISDNKNFLRSVPKFIRIFAIWTRIRNRYVVYVVDE